jgi:hypothetical protein
MSPGNPTTHPDTIWSCTTNEPHVHPVPPTSKLTEDQKLQINKTVANMPDATVSKVIKSMFIFTLLKLTGNVPPPELGDELSAVWQSVVEHQVKKAKEHLCPHGEGMEGIVLHCLSSIFVTHLMLRHNPCSEY